MMEKEVAVNHSVQESGLRDVEVDMDPESGRDATVEIEKIERVYRKLDYRIIPGSI